MDLEEAKGVLQANTELRARLERVSERLTVFETMDLAKKLVVDNQRTRLVALKENLLVWAALLDAAADAPAEMQEAFAFLLHHHADEMRRFAAKV